MQNSNNSVNNVLVALLKAIIALHEIAKEPFDTPVSSVPNLLVDAEEHIEEAIKGLAPLHADFTYGDAASTTTQTMPDTNVPADPKGGAA